MKDKFKDVIIEEKDDLRVVRISSIPEEYREDFGKFMNGQTSPLFPEEQDPMDWVYAWDWDNYLHKLTTGRTKFWD